MAKLEPWIHFYSPDGKELCAYTARGTFQGEMEATKEELAEEHGINPEEIIVKLTSGRDDV